MPRPPACADFSSPDGSVSLSRRACWRPILTFPPLSPHRRRYFSFPGDPAWPPCGPGPLPCSPHCCLRWRRLSAPRRFSGIRVRLAPIHGETIGERGSNGGTACAEVLVSSFPPPIRDSGRESQPLARLFSPLGSAPGSPLWAPSIVCPCPFWGHRQRAALRRHPAPGASPHLRLPPPLPRSLPSSSHSTLSPPPRRQRGVNVGAAPGRERLARPPRHQVRAHVLGEGGRRVRGHGLVGRGALCASGPPPQTPSAELCGDLG